MAIEDHSDIVAFRPPQQSFEPRLHLEQVSVSHEEPVAFDGRKKFPWRNAARIAITGDTEDGNFECYPDTYGIIVIVSEVNQGRQIGVS